MFNKKMKNKFITGLLFFVLVLFFSCGSPEEKEPEESILVEIGDLTISVSEFIRRSEYTVRPPYCKGSHNLDKKIVLNSLIAEKLIAMEATDTSEILKSERIQMYLQGLKEQAMRQWLYSKEADEKVQLDTTTILRTVKVAGRKYKLSYVNFPDSTTAFQLKDKVFKKGRSFKDAYYEMTGADSLPYREVEWSTQEHNMILDSLFTEPLKKNQFVGPIKVTDNEYIFAQVKGWIDRPIIIEKQFNDRWNDVSDKYRSRKAQELYNKFIVKIMKGKDIEFMPDIFYKMADLLGPQYLTTDKQKEEMLNNTVWNINEEEVDYSSLNNQIDELKDEPFFRVNDKIYKVKDFIKEVRVHPLVFRAKNMKRNEFGKQLQFAIMDLIRDKYLTVEAYNRNYDKINVVQRNVQMWRDNMNYIYYKEKYLHSVLPDSSEELNYITVLEDYLNEYVDSLQEKYNDQVKINIEKYNKIDLTKIDMNVSYNNQPYSRVVPSFPIITTDNKLDYGAKMNADVVN